MPERSRLVKMRVANIGCIGPEGLEVALDDVLCLVGANNTGKSTVLKAYELAVGTAAFKPDDLCLRADGLAVVEIWVHIPEGTANIAAKWKVKDGPLLTVRSRWEWNQDTKWSKVRKTWDPDLDAYAPDGNASGVDAVFTSRLPIPFKIGSLDDPEAEHKKLLTLVLQPIADKIKSQMSDESSGLRKAISSVELLANAPVEEERERLKELRKDLNKSHNAIFPGLELDLDISVGAIDLNPLDLLVKNSKLKFTDWLDKVSWAQQGTGSQRALFWTMLQVRSRLSAIAALIEQNAREMVGYEKQIVKLKKEVETAKKETTKTAKQAEIEKLLNDVAELMKMNPEEQLKKDEGSDAVLPGFMLLIDEPEIGLHPNAVRAASRHLYTLAEDKTWQVMLATHSPLFVDPLHDHTTIVRLERTSANPTPMTYRSDAVEFSKDEKENLKVLSRFDQGLAEMFFGQTPLLIEGDTEYAAFDWLANKDAEQFPLSIRPVLVRARGKYTMLLLIKILHQFKISFSILHDTDTPFRSDGVANSAWKANSDIYVAIEKVRAEGIRIVHRMSLPSFEHAHLPVQLTKEGRLSYPSGKDKPWLALQAAKDDATIETSIRTILLELLASDSQESPYPVDFAKTLENAVTDWAASNCPGDPRFFGLQKAGEAGTA